MIALLEKAYVRCWLKQAVFLSVLLLEYLPVFYYPLCFAASTTFPDFYMFQKVVIALYRQCFLLERIPKRGSQLIIIFCIEKWKNSSIVLLYLGKDNFKIVTLHEFQNNEWIVFSQKYSNFRIRFWFAIFTFSRYGLVMSWICTVLHYQYSSYLCTIQIGDSYTIAYIADINNYVSIHSILQLVSVAPSSLQWGATIALRCK